jgi:hypothetical protein
MPWKAIVQRLIPTVPEPPAPANRRGAMRAAAREALEHTGCPLCRLVAHRASRGLEAMLWDQATSPDAHPEWLAARGLCFEHGWAMVGASERVFSHGGTAVALQRLLTDFVDAATLVGAGDRVPHLYACSAINRTLRAGDRGPLP